MAKKSSTYKRTKKAPKWQLPLLLILVLVAVGFGVFIVFFSKAGSTSPQVYLTTSNTSSVATIPNSGGFTYGAAGDKIIACDWDGVPYGATNGSTVAAYRPSNSTFYISNNNASVNADPNLVFTFGATGDIPLCGNWDVNNGSAKPTVAVYRPSNSTFYLSNSDNKTVRTFYQLGSPGDIPIACDWNGDGVTDLGVYNPATSTFKLALKIFGNYGVFKEFTYGINGGSDIPVCGNWTGKASTTTNEFSTVGVYRTTDAKFYLRNSNSSGPADITTAYGTPSDKFVPVVGNWTGTKQTFIGAYRPGVAQTATTTTSTSTTTGSTATSGGAGTTVSTVDGDANTCTQKTLRRGVVGTCVAILRLYLDQRGRPVSDSTEINTNSFGANTEGKVKDFQYTRGITIDGVVGPQTWGQLKLATDPRSGGGGSSGTGFMSGAGGGSSLTATQIVCQAITNDIINSISYYRGQRAIFDNYWPESASGSRWRSIERYRFVQFISGLEFNLKSLEGCNQSAQRISTVFSDSSTSRNTLSQIVADMRTIINNENYSRTRR